MQQKLETEKYSKEQLVTKISSVTRENTQLKIKCCTLMVIMIRTITA